MTDNGRPVQEFFSIGEVCELTGLKPHVLRYWESQFRFLNPAKNRSGNRVYQRREIELIHAREAPALHGEVHDRRRAPEGRRASQGRATSQPRRAARLAAETLATLERQLAELLAVLDGASRCRRATTHGDESLVRILCTNDDGILAHGLECLVRAGEAARRGDRRRARSRAERDEPLAHAASSAAARARAASGAGRWTARRPTA